MMRRPQQAVLALLAAAAWTLPTAPALAAESISSLGAAFRPQGGNGSAAATATATVPATPTTPDANRSEQGERNDSAARGNTPGLRLVLSSPSRNLAAVDGQIVHVGDRINGMRVTEINAKGVLLMGEDGTRERLSIDPATMKRTQPAAYGAHGDSAASAASQAGSAKKEHGK